VGDIVLRHPIRFGIYTQQEQRSWPQMIEIWQAADEAGFDQAWLFDHFFPEDGPETDSCFESWTLLAALATQTKRIGIGVLVSGVMYRHPAILAKQAVTVDHVSGGRLSLGLGTGWREPEHRAYGIDLPSRGERVDRVGEALEMFRRLETQDRASFDGTHYRLDAAPFGPKPVHGHIPICLAALRPRMLGHVARYADQWDTWGGPEAIAANGPVVDAHATELGRDPRTIRWSICSGDDPVATFETQLEHIGRYGASGIDTFIYNMSMPNTPEAVRNVGLRLPELRQRFAGPPAASSDTLV
jgi:alkanesulfonate monooxygenase SsuD/methylene tetrahydromethanopterin reductase-like flavin-dependent oxidoreductase (luciferase family)